MGQLKMKVLTGRGEDLSLYISKSKNALCSDLVEKGALLFRGFKTSVELDEIARKIGFYPLNTYIPGIAPRKAYKDGNPFVFTSTEAPPHLPILPHTEMTYWPSPPDVLLFQCKNIDSSVGAGETVIFDMAASADKLDPSLLEKLRHGCVFQRFFPGSFNPDWDVAGSIAGGSCWQNAFATEDSSVVEFICKEKNVDYEWVPSKDNKPSSLITRVLLPWYEKGRLVLQTPLLGKAVYDDIICRFPSRFDNSKLKQSIGQNSVAPKVDLLCPTGEGNAPFLKTEEVSALMEAVWSQAVFVEWKQGDVLLIDNKAMAHARMNVLGSRIIVAVMAMVKM